MKLENLVQGATYSFERKGTLYTGTYQEYFWEAEDIRRHGITADQIGTRRSKYSKISDTEMVEIQVPNPKGGAPLGYDVALEDLIDG